MWMQTNDAAFAASVAAHASFARFRSLPIVQELNSREAMLLFSCLSEMSYAPDTLVYEAGTPSENTMHLILEGKVEVSDRGGQAYTTLGPGDVFGLFSFLDPERLHSATLRCLTEVGTLNIDRPYFDVVSLEEPALGQQLLRFMFRLLSRMALKLKVEYAALHSYSLARRT